MSLRFLLGRAGTGKTHACLAEIAATLAREGEEGPPLILLVPEQATFQMERALLERVEAGGTARAQVLSFRRLAQRVLAEAGGEVRPLLGEVGKRLLLRLQLVRLESHLETFGRSARKPGFVERLSRLVSELRAHAVEPGDLEDAARAADRAGGHSALAARLRDLARVLRAYDAALAGRYTDPDRRPLLVAERLPAATWLRGARVWVDGFAGFTPAEYRVLERLLAVALEVTVALCLDGRRQLGLPPAEADLFRQTHETYHRLVRAAERAGVPVTRVDVLDREGEPPRRFAGRPDLARIEAAFFRPGGAGAQDPVDAPSVEIIAAADPRREVEAVARQIVRLFRDEGMRPRDVAVVVRTFDPYAGWIRRIFTDYGIPFFIDQKRTLAHHPLVELVRSALEVVASDWEPEPVFRCLKTDLFPVERDVVDRLENYVLEHGIRGRLWYDGEPWRFHRRFSLEADPEDLTPRQLADLERLHQDRLQATGALVALHRRIAAARGAPLAAAELTRALYQLLADLEAGERLAAWAREAEAAGDLVSAGEHRQAWDGVLRVLDALFEVLGDEPVTLHEFRQVVEAGLESLRLALIPPALDQVLVGSVERSRQPDVRVTFILGANDGVFPAVPQEDPLLGDGDREALAHLGVELAPDSRLRLFHERYLAYIALTRPRERLWVCYSLTDGGGRQRQPSPLVTRLRELFPGLRERVFPEDPARPEDAEHPGRLLGAALAALRAGRRGGRVDPAWWGAWRWLVGGGSSVQQQARRLARALAEPLPVPRLPADLVPALYGEPLRASVSRLERFAACPFQHFAYHGLRIEERPEAEIDPARLGSFLHAALRRIVELAAGRGMDLGSAAEEARAALVDEVVDDLVPRLGAELALGTARQAYLFQRLRQTLRWVLHVLAEHARRGRFRIAATELGFGLGEEQALPPLRLEVDGRTVELRGRIDRVDVAEIDGQAWVRVVDYKSSRHRLSLADIYHGLALQLPAYLGVVVEHGPAWYGAPLRPAGAYYLPLIEPLAGAAGDEEAELRERRKEVRLAGLSVDDPEVIRAMDAEISGTSDLVQATLSERTGRLHRSDNLAAEEDIHALLAFVRRRVAELSGGILGGEIAPRPYRRPNGSVACGHCPFGSVCRFEGAYGRHRDLRPVDADTFWAEVRGG